MKTKTIDLYIKHHDSSHIKGTDICEVEDKPLSLLIYRADFKLSRIPGTGIHYVGDASLSGKIIDKIIKEGIKCDPVDTVVIKEKLSYCQAMIKEMLKIMEECQDAEKLSDLDYSVFLLKIRELFKPMPKFYHLDRVLGEVKKEVDEISLSYYVY